MAEKHKKVKWVRGRKSICENGQVASITRSFQMCPATLAAIKDFCARHKIWKSILVNEAIMSYIALNDTKEE